MFEKYRSHVAGICLIFTLLMIVELWPILGIRTSAELRDAIPDEYFFMSTILNMKDYMLAGNFKAVLEFGTPYGYGYIYWFLMGGIALLIKGLEFPDQVLFFRCVGILFKSLMLYCLFRSVERNGSTGMALASVGFILLMPGFWFYGKVISPEFIVLGFMSLSLYLLVKDQYLLKTFFWISVLVLGLIINIKMSVVPISLIWIIYLISSIKLNRARNYLILAKFLIVLVISYLVFNFTLVTHRGLESFRTWIVFNKNNTHFPSWENMRNFYNLNTTTWDRILNYGMKIDYVNIIFFILLTAIIIWSLCKRFDYLKLAMTVTSIVFLIFVLSTQIYHSWYLMAPFLLFSFSLFYFPKKNKWSYCLHTVLFLVLLASNLPQIIYKYEYRLAINRSMSDNYILGQEIKSYITQHGKSGDVILTNPFLALSNIDTMKIVTNSDMLFTLTFFNQSLFLKYPDASWILVDKNQGQGPGDWNSWNRLITTGIEVNGKLFRFALAKEFSNSKIYRKISE